MQRERLTGKLTRTNRPLETMLATLGFDRATINATLPFANRLHADAMRWMATVGFKSAPRRLDRRDADRALKMELAKIGGVE